MPALQILALGQYRGVQHRHLPPAFLSCHPFPFPELMPRPLSPPHLSWEAGSKVLLSHLVVCCN